MASKAEIETIRAMAYNDTAREIEAEGVELTHRQADELGAECVDWLSTRLGLQVEETDEGVSAYPRD